jgi:hypothetical protein
MPRRVSRANARGTIVGLTRAAFSIRRAVFPENAGGVDLRKQLRELFETTDTYLDLA